MDVRLLFTGIILPGGQRIFLTAELPYRLSIISSMNHWLVTIKQIAQVSWISSEGSDAFIGSSEKRHQGNQIKPKG